MDAAYLVIAFLLVFANGFFVAAEFAIVKVRATRMRELASGGSTRARAALVAISHLDAYLSATQLGITLASLALGWIGEPAFSHLLRPLVARLGITSTTVLHSVSATFAFAVITFLHIVLGELAPKSLAIRKSEATALWVARPLHGFFIVFYPALWLLNTSSNAILRLLGVPAVHGAELAHSEEELRMILADSTVRGLIPRTRGRLIENILKLGRRTARQVMLPRSEIRFLLVSAPWETNRRIILEAEYTRYPLCGKGLDEVLGFIHIKDLFNARPPVESSADLLRIKREILFVPEQQPLDRLQRDFQSRRQHIAIVVDEYGGTAGLVTLEDVLEELVGEIQDEFDSETPRIVGEGDLKRIDGAAPLEEVATSLGEVAPADAEAVTVGGLFLDRLGRIPREGDAVELGAWRLTVEEMRGRRVGRVRAERAVAAAEQESAAGGAAGGGGAAAAD
jgi:CBS domain containing-hemolysin-like protein